ncbi:hypothetical protein ACJW8F_10170 [Plesiomonas shigelloides]|uniref:hypothetical protein n=1 Tax=Plesiomonas shigelloides TaxID=703 RepID=UPI00387F0141
MRSEVLYALVAKLASILVSFVLVRACLSFLGSDSYSIWSTTFATFTIIMTLDFGLSNSFRSRINKLQASSKFLLKRSLISSLSAYNFILSGVVITALLLKYIFDSNFHSFILLVSAAINLYFSTLNVDLFSRAKSGVIDVLQLAVNFFFIVLIWLYGIFDVSSTIFSRLELASVSYFLINIIFRMLTFRLCLGFWIPDASYFKIDSKLKLCLKKGLAFFLAQMLFALYLLIDRYSIFYFEDSHKVVEYDLVFKVFNLILVFSLVFIKPLWRVFNSESNGKLFFKSYRMASYFIYVAYFCSLIFAFFFNSFSSVVFGYECSALLIDVLCIITWFFFTSLITRNCYVFNAIGLVSFQIYMFSFYILVNFLIILLLYFNNEINYSAILLKSCFTSGVMVIMFDVKLSSHLSKGSNDV